MEENFVSDSAVFDYEKTRWGHFHSIAEYSRDKHRTKVKVLVIEEGKNISYQKHNHRAEIWSILSGKGVMIVDGLPFNVQQGDVINIPLGTWHTARANDDSKLEILEIQYGTKTEEDDIERAYYEWKDVVDSIKKICR